MPMKFFLKYKSMGKNIIKKIFSTFKSPKPSIKNNKNYIEEKRNSEYHSQEEIYNILIKAKEAYLDCIEHNGVLYGMCYYIRSIPEVLYYIPIAEQIPKFNERFLLGTSDKIIGYWWSYTDTKSRIKAFDKLIDYYNPERV